MRFSVFFLAALALIACASAALELRCSSGTLQGVGGALFGIYTTKSGVQRPVSSLFFSVKRGNSVTVLSVALPKVFCFSMGGVPLSSSFEAPE